VLASVRRGAESGLLPVRPHPRHIPVGRFVNCPRVSQPRQADPASGAAAEPRNRATRPAPASSRSGKYGGGALGVDRAHPIALPSSARQPEDANLSARSRDIELAVSEP
jgi:hypothetical protein